MSNSSSRRKQFQPQRKPAAEIVENGICEDGSDGDEQDLGPASLNSKFNACKLQGEGSNHSEAPVLTCGARMSKKGLTGDYNASAVTLISL